MDWVKNFTEAETKFNEIGKLLANHSFNNNQIVEIFALTSLKMCRENAGAIKILLQNGFYIETMMIFRNQIELLFRLNWIKSSSQEKDRITKINSLEAKTFKDFNNEIVYLKKKKSKDFFTDKKVNKYIKALDILKANNPQYLSNNGKFIIKDNNIVMAGNLREKFYHQYRYLCIFTHPNPLLKEFYLTQDQGKSVFGDAIQSSCNYAMKVFKLNLNIIIDLLGDNFEEMIIINKHKKKFNDFVGEC